MDCMEKCYVGTAVDWRDIGALTEVHSQGSCGACWAITAVETVESVHFIATGQLYDLSVRNELLFKIRDI